jgi:hypothetical protein
VLYTGTHGSSRCRFLSRVVRVYDDHPAQVPLSITCRCVECTLCATHMIEMESLMLSAALS